MKKILLIDDSDTYTWCLQKYLQHRGYPVKTACTLKEARAAIQEEMPLVVCCDLDLPDGFGMDFLDAVSYTHLSRLETGVIQLDKKPGRLFDTVAQAMSGIVYAAEKKDIAVSVDCPEDLTFFHDSKWTSEALFNLLDNAVKYTPAGGKIAVSVVLWEMYVEIKVTDTGKGISESNQAAIFRRFYREEEVHEQQGVGIGLYLAREIVTRQGGYIKVVSEPGQGSEFSIMLPVK